MYSGTLIRGRPLIIWGGVVVQNEKKKFVRRVTEKKNSVQGASEKKKIMFGQFKPKKIFWGFFP